MTPEVTNALLQYEEYKLQAKDLEEKMDVLKLVILPVMELGKKLEGHSGSFELKERATWKYSPELEEKKAEIKGFEAEEVAKGIATKKATQYLEYRVAKGE